MTDLKLPSDNNGEKKPVSSARLAIWIIVGGIGVYLVATGLYGVITKG
jgi:hypothetical protein